MCPRLNLPPPSVRTACRLYLRAPNARGLLAGVQKQAKAPLLTVCVGGGASCVRVRMCMHVCVYACGQSRVRSRAVGVGMA